MANNHQKKIISFPLTKFLSKQTFLLYDFFYNTLHFRICIYIFYNFFIKFLYLYDHWYYVQFISMFLYILFPWKCICTELTTYVHIQVYNETISVYWNDFNGLCISNVHFAEIGRLPAATSLQLEVLPIENQQPWIRDMANSRAHSHYTCTYVCIDRFRRNEYPV